MLKKSFFLVMAVFLAVAVQFAVSGYRVLQTPALDFSVLYNAGKEASLGENTYLKGETNDFHTPPPSLLIFSLLPLLPINESQSVWFILSLLSFVIGSYFIVKTLSQQSPKGKRLFGFPFWTIYLTLALIFFPFRYNLGSGEVNNFLFLCLGLTFYLLNKKKNLGAAIFLSIGIIIKITPLFFLLLFLLQKKFRVLLATLGVLALLELLTIIIFGPELSRQYFFVTPRYFNLLDPVYYNQSLAAVLLRISPNPLLVKNFVYPILFTAMAFYLYLFYRLPKKSFLGTIFLWNIGILYTLIFSTFAWQHHYTIAFFPLITTWYLIAKNKLPFFYFGILAASYLLMAINIKQPAVFSHYGFVGDVILSHVFWGGLILLILNWLIIFKRLRQNQLSGFPE